MSFVFPPSNERCPDCGRPFGEHDWTDATNPPIGDMVAAVCPGSEHLPGPTPAGGAYARVFRRGRDVEIVEYDPEGNSIARTYGEVGEE